MGTCIILVFYKCCEIVCYFIYLFYTIKDNNVFSRHCNVMITLTLLVSDVIVLKVKKLQYRKVETSFSFIRHYFWCRDKLE